MIIRITARSAASQGKKPGKAATAGSAAYTQVVQQEWWQVQQIFWCCFRKPELGQLYQVDISGKGQVPAQLQGSKQQELIAGAEQEKLQQKKEAGSKPTDRRNC